MSEPIDWAAVRKALVGEFDYSEHAADGAAAKLQHLEPSISESFAAWWKDGSLMGPEIDGYSVGTLVTDRGMKPPAAFLAMNWLCTDHDIALETLNRRRYDVIRRWSR